MVRKLPAYMTEILLGKCVKWNKHTKNITPNMLKRHSKYLTIKAKWSFLQKIISYNKDFIDILLLCIQYYFNEPDSKTYCTLKIRSVVRIENISFIANSFNFVCSRDIIANDIRLLTIDSCYTWSLTMVWNWNHNLL
jgi:hypothetical protein